ncbi:hypothetical protein SUVZ_02G6390 [Saccharomyces uvarum]|uniref:Uncharacterized protein n=1 Tax=Saccharomyces uvarum TaxID=230603 RepID=A0ABN8WTR1_SACUV|nr:hypothetical protein SUVZ_02G6390 [Saccharomyces uvarum]
MIKFKSSIYINAACNDCFQCSNNIDYYRSGEPKLLGSNACVNHYNALGTGVVFYNGYSDPDNSMPGKGSGFSCFFNKHCGKLLYIDWFRNLRYHCVLSD